MKIKNLLLSALFVCGFTSTNLFGQVPTANFSVNPSIGCSGQTFTITNMSTGAPTAWSYTLAGGTPSLSTVPNPTVTFAAGGVHNITLVVTNSVGVSAPVVKSVTVIPTPTLIINPATAQGCSGTTFTATFFGSGAATYTWSTGANTASVAIPNPSTTTIYTLTGSNGICNAIPKTATITINALPNVTVVANPTVVCGPSIISMTANATGVAPFTYSWMPSGGTGSVAATPVPGTFTVKVTSSQGCIKTGTVNIANGTIPTLSIMPTSITVCQGQPAALTTTGTATSWTWNTGATTSSVTVTPSVTTNYTVVGYNGTCTRTATRTVNVLASTPLTISSTSSVLCLGQTATLTANPSGTVAVLAYSWTTGSTTSVTAVSPTTTSTYTVFAINSNSCTSGAIFVQNVSACTGVNQIAVQSTSFGLYPNPSSGDFTVTIPDTFENSTIEIYNGLGQLVSRNKAVNTSTKINIANEANGVYHVRIMQDGKQVYRTKVLKN